MRYIIRIISSPFILGLVLITHISFAFKRTFDFIRYGGEFSNYDKNERATIQDVYEKLKQVE